MNYGKYFRLNLKESKVVDGIAVYDYIDLPAYFGRSKSISPKYPITAVICQDSVRFRLHYCAYKVEQEEGKVFQYFYSSEEALKKHCVEVRMVHMQEIILELPFVNEVKESLTDAINNIYFTSFPLLGADCNTEKKDNEGFIYQLLSKRYRPDKWNWETSNTIEEESYKSLQKNIDGDKSYSTLWLMGLQREGIHEDKQEGPKYIDLTDGEDEENNVKAKYVGFLRKLLLDFMFDLAHSDIFQSSPNYTAMYSGLKSNFLFSALMHKCEYYYYRGLTLDAISDVEKLGAIPKDDKDNRKKFIRELYATKLFEAEKAWVEDITNPLAEQYFKESDDDFLSHEQASIWKKIKNWWEKGNRFKVLRESFRNWLNESFRTCIFVTRPNWFADPEEEMRRVCFTMKDIDSKKNHLCNSETVAEYLNIKSRDGVMDLRVHISRWFLRRNAFLDVLHLHVFKYAHITIPILIFCIAGWMLLSGSTFFSQDWWCTTPIMWRIILGTWLAGLVVSLSMWIILTYYTPKLDNKRDIDVLEGWRKRLVAKRMFWWVIFGGVDLSLFFVAINAAPQYNIWALLAAVAFALVALILSWTDIIHIKLVKNVHLLLPRLVASIAAAWLSLAIGNELFQSFFDALPSWLTCGLLSFVVLFFILYEMNKSIPNKSGLVKLIRSIEMLVASYLVSIVVGLFIINFTGERFMERSGYLETFHSEYLANTGDSAKFVYNQDYYYKEGALSKDSLNRDYLNDLENLTITRHGAEESSCGPVITYWEVQVGDETHRFFVLRDFLIQFAFLAMFIGVFIQMIFEEKSITDM